MTTSDLHPYWNATWAQVNSHLWLPTAQDAQGEALATGCEVTCKLLTSRGLHSICSRMIHPGSAVKASGIYYTISGSGLQYAEVLPNIEHDCRLVYSHGRWYLCIPYKKTMCNGENQARIVAPGSRDIICGSDGISMHRDMNGARGILLRALAEAPSAEPFRRALMSNVSICKLKRFGA